LLDLRLFADRTFSSALGAVTAVFFAMFGVSYLLSQYIQFVQGVSAFGVGLRFLPLAAGTLLTSNTAARLTQRFGLRRVLIVGMVLVTAGLACFASLTIHSGFTIVGIAFGCIGLGMGLVIAPASNAIIGTLSPDKVGAGSGLRSTVQLLGGSFGVAIIGSLAASRYRDQIQHAFSGPLAGVPQAARPAVDSQIGEAIGAAAKLPPGLAKATTTAANQAYVSGVRLSALVGVVVMVLATVAASIYVPKHVQPLPEDDIHGAASHF
jgi:MFS family permease